MVDTAVENTNSDSFRRLDETAVAKRHAVRDYALLHKAPVAERVGFEPTEPRSSTVFKTAAIDHSATSPCGGRLSCSNADLEDLKYPIILLRFGVAMQALHHLC